MKSSRKQLNAAEREKILAELHRDVLRRQKGYRERALSMFPHVCASCGREFSGVKIRELTVHHKDHNHDNNPPDGSNWELLCVYCHDHEHEKHLMAGFGGGSKKIELRGSTIFNPFDQLDRLVKPDEKNGDAGAK